MTRTDATRRRVLQIAAGATTGLAGLAGCTGGSGSEAQTDGEGTASSGGGEGTASSGGGGGSGGGSTPSFGGYLDETSDYDGVVDRTGQSEVTVDVGVEANGGYYGFGPAAIRVSTGTTVVWKWTGNGSYHNVVAEDGSFESEQKREEGYTFSQTFEESGTVKYYCAPHEALGMKGVVVVEE